jgi:hypothetical protein
MLVVGRAELVLDANGGGAVLGDDVGLERTDALLGADELRERPSVSASNPRFSSLASQGVKSRASSTQ